MESKAYTQAYRIIQQLPKEQRQKIPAKVIEAIKSKMDCSYDFVITEELENIELLEDTEKILSVIYTDYLATMQERERIRKKEKSYFIKEEQNKRANYANLVFPNKKGVM